MSRSQSLAALSPKSLRDRWSGTRSFFLVKTTQPLQPSEASSDSLKRQTSDQKQDMPTDWSTEEESDFARGLRHELSLRLAAPGLETGDADCLENLASKRDDKRNRDEATSDASVRSDTLPVDISELQDEFERVREEHKQVEAAWKRENMKLREQLASTNQREAAQRQQLRTCEDNLAMCQQELEELKMRVQEQPSETQDASDTPAEFAARERAMLQFVLDLVGRDQIRALLNDFPDASPSQLRQEMLQLVHIQQHFSTTISAPVIPRSIAPTQRASTTKKLSSSPSPPSRSPSTLDAVYEKYVRGNSQDECLMPEGGIVPDLSFWSLLLQGLESERGQMSM